MMTEPSKKDRAHERWVARLREHPNLEEWKQQEEVQLLKSIGAHLEELERLLEKCSGNWGYEDPVYRFYHQSCKVFYVQERTQEIVAQLQALAPHLPLNDWFTDIVQAGTGKVFSLEDNENWTPITRPVVEAFFHARYFLEMICKYGRQLQSPPETLPSGWAAVLYLYNLR
jgi:hypothetical protein